MKKILENNYEFINIVDMDRTRSEICIWEDCEQTAIGRSIVFIFESILLPRYFKDK